jgi:hypothetical protein
MRCWSLVINFEIENVFVVERLWKERMDAVVFQSKYKFMAGVLTKKSLHASNCTTVKGIARMA